MPDLPGVRLPALLRTGAGATEGDPSALADALQTLWELPKVELHLHLEGTLRPETVCELASRYEPSSPLCRPGWQSRYWRFRDLAGFITEFRHVLRTCLRTAEDYYRLAAECFEDLAAQHVVYAEVGFSARAPGWPNYVPLEELLAAVDQARRDVEGRTLLRVGLLLGINRAPRAGSDIDPEAFAVELVRGVVRARDDGTAMVGIDLHGDEQTFPDVDPFVGAYRVAAAAGLGLRAHAGESGGPANVRAALDRLNVRRVAHGVRAVEDPTLVARLARERVALDVCPTSNVLTGAVPSLERHPIRALDEAGVALTVSSDDPLVFETTLTAELALLYRRLGFSLADLGRFMAQAAEHAFLPDGARSSLADAIRAAWPGPTRSPA